MPTRLAWLRLIDEIRDFFIGTGKPNWTKLEIVTKIDEMERIFIRQSEREEK